MAKWRGPRGYVENVAAAVALAATSARATGRIYNVAESQPITELDWARKVASVAGWDGKFKVVPDECAPAHLQPPGNAEQHWVADSTRIRRELGYQEPVEQDVAISRTLEWMRANPARNTAPHVFDYVAEDAAITTVHT
jgi:nucleoside-diphosphate-sugar epimerase